MESGVRVGEGEVQPRKGMRLSKFFIEINLKNAYRFRPLYTLEREQSQYKCP